MGNDGIGTDTEYTTDVSDTRAVHSHGYNAVMSPGLIPVIAVVELEALVAVTAQIPLMSGVCFSVFNDSVRLIAMNTHNVNYSHESLKKRGS